MKIRDKIEIILTLVVLSVISFCLGFLILYSFAYIITLFVIEHGSEIRLYEYIFNVIN